MLSLLDRYWVLFRAGADYPARLDGSLRHAVQTAREQQVSVLPLGAWRQLEPQADSLLADYYGVFLADPRHCYPLRLFRYEKRAQAYAARIRGHVLRLRDWQYAGPAPVTIPEDLGVTAYLRGVRA